MSRDCGHPSISRRKTCAARCSLSSSRSKGLFGTLRVIRAEKAILARAEGATNVLWVHNGQASVFGPGFLNPQRVPVPRRVEALMQEIGYVPNVQHDRRFTL